MRKSRPSPALVVALMALIVAMGGTGYAALKLPRNSVGTKQIKPNAVTSGKVKNGSLLASDFGPGQLPAGAVGAPGTKGDKGDKGDKGNDGNTGSRGPSDVYGAARPTVQQGVGPYEIVLSVPAGDYAVSGTMTVHDVDTNSTAFSHPPDGSAICSLFGGGVLPGTGPESYSTVPGTGFEFTSNGLFFAGGAATIALVGRFHLATAGPITLSCDDASTSTSPPLLYAPGEIYAVRVAELH